MATSTITAPFFIRERSSRSDQSGRSGSGDQDRADNQVGALNRLDNGVSIRVERRDVGRHDIIEVAQAIQIDVKDPHVGAEPGGDFGRVGADHSAPQDCHLSRGNPRYTGQQNAAALLGTFEILGSLLDTHPPGNFAHWCQERKAAARIAQRFVRDRRDAAGDDGTCERLVGGKMKVGENDGAGPQ